MKILLNETLETEVDPNPNGLPVLIITLRGANGRIRTNFMLGKEQAEELVATLQRRLTEM